MKMSPAGRKMYENFEALVLHAYRDAKGIPTIGYGHTSAAGSPNVFMGMVITPSEADTILSTDLLPVENSVLQLIHVPLNQAQFDALCDFQMNTWWLAHPQCSLRRALNAGNYQLAADDFALYDEAAGHVLRGLVRRREAERTLFLTGRYP
jgi:GH24 family phage-related lysozyme (muramidase)